MTLCRPSKRAVLFWTAAALTAAVETLLTAAWMVGTTAPRVFDSVQDIPPREYGMVLGTSKDKLHRPGMAFDARIRAAALLYHAGKVKKLVVSGTAHEWDFYDEPADMRRALVSLGVPSDAILLDGKGFRTLDSIIRMRTVFGIDDFITVSQADHCRRAIFLADHNAVSTIGFDAGLPPGGSPAERLNNIIREPMARVKAVMDAAFHRSAKFEH